MRAKAGPGAKRVDQRAFATAADIGDAAEGHMSAGLSPLLDAARAFDLAGRPAEALAEAWSALDQDRDDPEAKALIAKLLRRNQHLAGPDRWEDMARLVADPALEPLYIAPAAWRSLLTSGAIGPSDDPATLAERIETDDFILRLLEESFVSVLEAELVLTSVRRWLLVSGRWPEFPRLVAALALQAQHNGGAWPFDSEEEILLDAAGALSIAATYRPQRPKRRRGAGYGDAVTEAVADQYENWPYPIWSRVNRPLPTTVPAEVRKRDCDRDSGLPVNAEIFVAGCGTGREAAIMALNFPDAKITAIDISSASLAYASDRCRAAGISGIEFRALDLHRVAELGKTFDLIVCSGVLHHLPDPEAGWSKLVEVLRPGGAMRVMVYSKIGRLPVRAARTHIADLLDRPVDDDLLREARRRIIEKAPTLLAAWSDFYNLGGVHDLLLHRHEDAFDVARIGRALDRLGLELLAFELPTPSQSARYRQENPNDPAFRDLKAWTAMELREPYLFRSMYEFWCRKPLK